MARVEIAAVAVEDLERLTFSHSLPSDARERVRRSIQPLGQFPLLGAPLGERWAGLRFILGPWRWLIIVYVYIELEDRIVIVTMQDGRSARAG